MKIEPRAWLQRAHECQNEAVRALQQGPPDFRAHDRHLAMADAYKRLVGLAFAREVNGVPRAHPIRHGLWIFASGVVCAGFWLLVVFALYEASRVLVG